MPTQAIRVAGLAEFSRALRQTDTELSKAIRLAFNDVAEVVAKTAREDMPHRSGRAAASVKPKSTARAVRVIEGGNKAPYVPWLDFGGRVGRKKRTRRRVLQDGRYLYPSFAEHIDEIPGLMSKAIREVATRAGLGVD